MKIVELTKITNKEVESLLSRKTISYSNLLPLVTNIFEEIKTKGESGLKKISNELDNNNRAELILSEKELRISAMKIDLELKNAIDEAYENIWKFHLLQKPDAYSIEIKDGIQCSRKPIPIENVGLYIPGGTAVLFSTLLMLAVPAKIAGCKRIVVTSPFGGKEISPALAYTAEKCGIREFYSVGGAQAIAMFALGTENIKKVDKIFGPGNQYVTAAKVLLPLMGTSCMIDMPAGPSELLVIADNSANPKYIAADLLSQAEHGVDSQVILMTDDLLFANKVNVEINKQTKLLPRKEYVNKCLENSACIVTSDLEKAIELSNYYAPEHLIINTKCNEDIALNVTNAGSVFVGEYSCESAGDYASGTNHSLPTNGYAKSIGGVNVEMFMKNITFQSLTKFGLNSISNTIIKMAEAEELEAHANAVKVRLN